MNADPQIDDLQGKITDRGWVLTLEDALFTRGKVDLKSDAVANLNKLILFLSTHTSHSVMIEGHTDSSGGAGYNHSVSQRRAESVQSYLVERGVRALRIMAVGKGESMPVAGNDSETGRQQNRRVEIIISDSSAALS
ncbi:MAG: OmpA family protein [Gammaproteobacteria bacterium]